MTHPHPMPATGYRTPADALVRANLGLVRRIAWHVHGSAGGLLDIDDLVQIGLIALVEAGRTTTETNEAAFAAYARTRVRGAMIDELRRAAPQSRGDMARRQRLARAQATLAARLGREPTAHELADDLGMEVGVLLEQQAATASVRFDPLPDGEEGQPLADDRPDALACLLDAEDAGALAAALSRLSERHARVLQLYFVDDLNLAEVGAVLGVSAPRCHQIKAAALAALRVLLEEPGVNRPTESAAAARRTSRCPPPPGISPPCGGPGRSRVPPAPSSAGRPTARL